ncbi:WXG100 family type VII secretion target [Streptomyces albus]|uniref:WXG100 family type VII secretion target n=1 Tax=Streptomyces albus TaxID=1888 RepID=UPI0004C5C397|nr:WXG100 family type VII secretion target [Streptomyces albus]
METAVNYDTVTQAANDVRVTSRELAGKLGDLMADVTRFTADWRGEAGQAYAEIQADVDLQMEEMTGKLKLIAERLDQSVVGYQDTDRGNAARFRMSM